MQCFRYTDNQVRLNDALDSKSSFRPPYSTAYSTQSDTADLIRPNSHYTLANITNKARYLNFQTSTRCLFLTYYKVYKPILDF